MAQGESEEGPRNFLDLLVKLKGPKSFDERMAEAEEALRERVLSYVSREELPFRRRIEYLQRWLEKTVADLTKKKRDYERMESERRDEAERLKQAASEEERQQSPLMLVGALLVSSSADDIGNQLEGLERLQEELQIISEIPDDRLNQGDSIRRLLDAVRIPARDGSAAPATGDGLRVSVPQDAFMAFRRDHPDYDRNVFIMMSFAGEPSLAKVWTELSAVLKSHGLRALRADQKTYGKSRQIWDNLITYMHGCRYGIAVLEQETADDFNPNVALEYGFMRALGKNVLLLKEKRFRKIRADILGTIWMEFDVAALEGSVRRAIDQWVKDIR
jgi:hypothetical protein